MKFALAWLMLAQAEPFHLPDISQKHESPPFQTFPVYPPNITIQQEQRQQQEVYTPPPIVPVFPFPNTIIIERDRDGRRR